MSPAFPTDAPFEQATARPMVPLIPTGSVQLLLRAEAFIELAFAVAAYRYFGGNWRMFAVLFLVPDLTMVGYLANPRVGARLYNLGHSTIGPALLGLAGFMLTASALYPVALLWVAHIGFDRVLGYGLKYPAAFGATHLNRN